MENITIQDNHIYKYTVDFEQQELILNTKTKAKELVDIVFSDLAAYLFEDTITGCIILDLDEWPIDDVIDYLGEEYLLSHQKYDWPFTFTNLDDLKAKIAKRGLIIYNLASSYGMSGFIFAKSVKFIPHMK
jgi:hypothetical protein